MVITQLHLNFGELSETMRTELKQFIINNYSISLSRRHGYTYAEIKKKLKNIDIDAEIDKLFDLNNAGIDIDIFGYMN